MKIWIGALCLLLGFSSMACDLCGCYMGVQPQLEKNAIGLRWRYRYFSGNVPHVHGNGEVHNHANNQSDDYYNTIDLYARWYPHPRVQVFALLPYVTNALYEGNNLKRHNGIGDGMVMAQYRLVYKTKVEKDAVHQLFAGGGIKLPFGKYKVEDKNGEIEPHSQAGTGSLDYLIVANYLVRKKKIGFNAEASYRISGKNDLDFRFANRFNMAAHVFYWAEVKKASVLPNGGFYFETAGMDQLNNHDYLNTGGSVFFGSAGLDVYMGKFKLSYTIQLPAYEDLIGSQVKNKMRMVGGVTYFFNNNNS